MATVREDQVWDAWMLSLHQRMTGRTMAAGVNSNSLFVTMMDKAGVFV